MSSETNEHAQPIETTLCSEGMMPESAFPWFTTAFLIGLIICTCFIATSWYFGGSHPVSPETDSLVYLQYARQLVAGQPYVFTEGAEASTGSTSHIYPAVLAVFYLFGARGSGLETAHIFFAAACFLAFLYFYWGSVSQLSPRAAPIALLLTVLSGQTAYSAFGQTDGALFMVIVWAAAYAGLRRRYGVQGILIFLGVFCRPEAAVLGFIWLAYVLVCRRDEDDWRRAMLPGLGALLGLVLVFGANALITGSFNFQSLGGKQYFSRFPFFGALGHASRDFAELVRETLFGATGGVRSFYVLPIVGGLLAVAGIVGFRFEDNAKRRIFHWLLLGLLAVYGVVALSGWQGVSIDRYLGWGMPLWYLSMALGAVVLTERLKSEFALPVLVAIMLIYQLAGLANIGVFFAESCRFMSTTRAFTERVAQALPAKSTVGGLGYPGLAYYMPKQKFVNFFGITNPRFSRGDTALANLELLKYEPRHRPDVWLLRAASASPAWSSAVLGDKLMEDSDALVAPQNFALYKSDYSTLLALPPHTTTLQTELAGKELADRLDIGYYKDEERCKYRSHLRLKGVVLRPCVSMRKLQDREFTEVGRAVIGYETFTVQNMEPERSMTIVMRTSTKAAVQVLGLGRETLTQTITMANRPHLRFFIEDQVLDVTDIAIVEGDEVFTDVMINVPASFVTSTTLDIVVGGDHISYGYWFYQ